MRFPLVELLILSQDLILESLGQFVLPLSLTFPLDEFLVLFLFALEFLIPFSHDAFELLNLFNLAAVVLFELFLLLVEFYFGTVLVVLVFLFVAEVFSSLFDVFVELCDPEFQLYLCFF